MNVDPPADRSAAPVGVGLGVSIRILWERIFPDERLGRADYILTFALLGACFVLFCHEDIWITGWDSLSYLYGDPLEFYENSLKFRGDAPGHGIPGAPYPPSIYLIFALWLYPFKVLGLIKNPEAFSFYYVYWLKVLTTTLYIASGVVFHRIALGYSSNKDWATRATAVWLTMPIALFSQFIFSQYDIFYVLLTLVGFLMFLRSRLYLAALIFGFAITFKYFPVFVFLPLLLLYEKRVSRILVCLMIFAIPMLIIEALYGQSAAYLEYVKNHFALDRVYSVAIDLSQGAVLIYLLFAAFAILCAIAYCTEVATKARSRVAAYIYLVSSILPFLFTLWHAQWAMFLAPAIALSSMLGRQRERLSTLDLVGMFFFVAAVSLIFEGNVDAAMFKGQLFGMDFHNSYYMSGLFSWFGAHSGSVFLSAFWAYLVSQIILKFKLLRERKSPEEGSIGWNEIRQRMYIGLAIFLVPAFVAIYKDMKGDEIFAENLAEGRQFGELLSTRVFEQTFVARGTAIKEVSLLLTTFGRQNIDDVTVAILNASGIVIGRAKLPTWRLHGTVLQSFRFDSVRVSSNDVYRIRLTSRLGTPSNAITWWASEADSYSEGHAIVDGVPQNADFSFRVNFVK